MCNNSLSGLSTSSGPFRCLTPHLHLCLHLAQWASTSNWSRRTLAAPGPKPVIPTLWRFTQIAQLLTDSPATPSKPPVMPMKPDAMPLKTPGATPSKTPGATPMKPPVMPSTSSDPSLRPPAMPKKCALTPQKAIPCGSGDSAKDILDRVNAKYRAGMSPQYSNMLALLTSGKSSQMAAPKCTDSDTPAGGDHANHPYVKLARSDSDSDHKKSEPPNKRVKRDPGSGPEVADTRSHSSKKNSSKKTTKKTPKSKETIMLDSDSSESENLCGKLHSQPTKEEVVKCQCQCTDKWASDLP